MKKKLIVVDLQTDFIYSKSDDNEDMVFEDKIKKESIKICDRSN